MSYEFTAILPGFHPDQDGVPQLWAVTEWRDGVTFASREKGKAWPAGTVFAYCVRVKGKNTFHHIAQANPSVRDWSAINRPGCAASHEEAVKKAYTLAHAEAAREAAEPAKFTTLFRKKEDGSESFASIPVEHAWFSEQGLTDGVCFEHVGGGIHAQYYWQKYPTSPYAGGKEQKTIWQGVKWLRDCWVAGKAKTDVAAAQKTTAAGPLKNDTPGHIFWKKEKRWWLAPEEGTTENKKEACIYTYEDFLLENDRGLEFHPLVPVPPTQKRSKIAYEADRRAEKPAKREGDYSFSGDADFRRILQENPGKNFIICRGQHEKYRNHQPGTNGLAEMWVVIERRKTDAGNDYPHLHYYGTKEAALAGARKEKWTVFPELTE